VAVRIRQRDAHKTLEHLASVPNVSHSLLHDTVGEPLLELARPRVAGGIAFDQLEDETDAIENNDVVGERRPGQPEHRKLRRRK
jgi:hypothetical protein